MSVCCNSFKAMAAEFRQSLRGNQDGGFLRFLEQKLFCLQIDLTSEKDFHRMSDKKLWAFQSDSPEILASSLILCVYINLLETAAPQGNNQPLTHCCRHPDSSSLDNVSHQADWAAAADFRQEGLSRKTLGTRVTDLMISKTLDRRGPDWIWPSSQSPWVSGFGLVVGCLQRHWRGFGPKPAEAKTFNWSIDSESSFKIW